jgi:hypothetical protein
MLTAIDKKFIAEILSESSERYPLTIMHAFKGKGAFDLHAKMISLDQDWLTSFSESQKNKSLLLVFIKRTVSKATLKDPSKQPATSVQRLFTVFDAPGSLPVRSGVGYSSAPGKKWLKLVDEYKNHNLL